MPAIERQITINASPEQVFAYLSDITRHPEWAGHDLKGDSTSPGPSRHYFRLQPEDGGTLLTKGSDPLRLSLMLKLLMPVGRLYMVPRGLDGDLKRIKANLDGGSASAGRPRPAARPPPPPPTRRPPGKRDPHPPRRPRPLRRVRRPIRAGDAHEQL